MSQPEVSTDDEVYVVEAVLDCRTRKGKVEYKIKWEGWTQTTWEPEDACDCDELIKKYQAEHPQKPRNSVSQTPTRRNLEKKPKSAGTVLNSLKRSNDGNFKSSSPSTTRNDKTDGRISTYRIQTEKPSKILGYKVENGEIQVVIGFNKAEGPRELETTPRDVVKENALELYCDFLERNALQNVSPH